MPQQTPRPPTADGPPVLLTGGNPQIAKGDGDAPVRAYLDALGAGPAWKQTTCRQLDALIVKALPEVRKAVRWNSPFYGARDESLGWFLSYHCMTKYVKVAFHHGVELTPEPPVGSKHPRVRYVHLQEGEALDEQQWTSWIEQAAKLEGERCF